VFKPRKRYDKGKAPCGRCLVGRHECCRPRLDGSLCSCTCIKAEMIRSEVDRRTKRALESGLQVPGLVEMIGIICPYYKPGY
jgi:hypothetical protein